MRRSRKARAAGRRRGSRGGQPRVGRVTFASIRAAGHEDRPLSCPTRIFAGRKMRPQQLKRGRRHAPTPLWVIALFVSTAETVSGIAVTHTSGGVQVSLAAFVIAFPLLVAAAFFAILWFRPHHFYAPSEYGSRVGPREFIDALTVAKPYDRDNAGAVIRLFWRPDGRKVDKSNEEKLRSGHFASLRAKAVEDLKLRMKQGT
jgi:hypothetical protein